ncbi:hypothetical protein SAMN04489844_1956 [Nocardioides exalbidus]|uniref:Dolichyl-phosphate-mannose-protein mannosyltransferase n=1 Tax=Nocardioides exalbidus TaxID=402596 RepID=A0A1H4R0E0_9ACTN|nr:hypothetical protein [Nocardioides exalbidus]SEC25227.1 hypothetical protein SAMN04489844_1956 [Nocardioides exalbidus]
MSTGARGTRGATLALAALAALAWIPFVDRPLSSDEGGFLLVASQWHPGRSLYGHYWVDRPPLLITVFDLAAHLGGAVGLRLIGIVAVVTSVLLASLLAASGAGRRTLTPAIVAALFLSSPLFGTTEVNGELLAVPLVLTGLVALVHAWSPSRRAPLWAALAGASGMAAAMVKQNVVDVFVVAAVLVLLAARRHGLRRAAALASGVAAGAGAALVATLVVAEARGTEPVRLWHAVVLFRAHAAAVIQASATSSTSDRFAALLGAAALSGAPLVLAVLLLRLRGRAPADDGRHLPDLRIPALALVAWELVAVGAGGSYWLHYLIGLVPGLVLLAVAAAQRGARLPRSTAVALAVATVSCVAAVTVTATLAPRHGDDTVVASYLRSHSSPGDSVVVGFGHPDIVYDSGLPSPYGELWSLPVRVRDSSLTRLTHVLSGRRAPTWVVVAGGSLATWGVDPTTAQEVLDARYRPATTVGPYVVWRRTTTGPSRSAAQAFARRQRATSVSAVGWTHRG